MGEKLVPPMSEADFDRIGRRLYPDPPPPRPEGVWLDVSMDRMREYRTKRAWFGDQARKLHRYFSRLRTQQD